MGRFWPSHEQHRIRLEGNGNSCCHKISSIYFHYFYYCCYFYYCYCHFVLIHIFFFLIVFFVLIQPNHFPPSFCFSGLFGIERRAARRCYRLVGHQEPLRLCATCDCNSLHGCARSKQPTGFAGLPSGRLAAHHRSLAPHFVPRLLCRYRAALQPEHRLSSRYASCWRCLNRSSWRCSIGSFVDRL